MKNYTITVNGKAYDVSVEEKGGTASLRLQQHQHLQQHQRLR